MSSHPEGSSGSGTASGSGGSGRRIGQVLRELRKKVSKKLLKVPSQTAPTVPVATTQGSTQGSVPPRVRWSPPSGGPLVPGGITGPASLTQVDTVQTPAIGERTSPHDPSQPPRTPESTSSQRTSTYEAGLTAENQRIARYGMNPQRPTSIAGTSGHPPSLQVIIPSVTIPSITTSPVSFLQSSVGSSLEQAGLRPPPGPSINAVSQAPSDSLPAQSSGILPAGHISWIQHPRTDTGADPSVGHPGQKEQ